VGKPELIKTVASSPKEAADGQRRQRLRLLPGAVASRHAASREALLEQRGRLLCVCRLRGVC